MIVLKQVFVITIFSLAFLVPSVVFAATSDGSVDSTVEINETTANVPALENQDFSGYSVANIGDLDGDGVNDLAVGIPGAGHLDPGEVRIMFMNADGSVKSTVEIDKDTANGPSFGAGDYFGSAIANIGDLDDDGVNDIAVGAEMGDLDRGEVHIMFMNADGSIDSSVEISASANHVSKISTISDDNFGRSVANIGDLDGDGVNDLAVGAPKDHAGGSDRGQVYIIFMNADGSVDSTVKIDDTTTNGPDLTNNDNFGHSVANIGDLDGDGVNDLAVGAPEDNTGGADRGTVHILFMNADGSVDSTVDIDDDTTNGPDLADEDYFGHSVANIGDLDGDGVNDLAVGASHDAEGGADRGTVHILFMNADGSVDSTVEINDSTANGPELYNADHFGYSVANIGDLDGDGVNDLAVGAPHDNAGGSDRGTVHILFLHNTTTENGGSENGGSHCNDCTAPSIGISKNHKDPVRVIDDGITFNEKSFDVREFAKIYDTIHTQTGVTNTIQLKIYEDSKPENVRKAILYLGLNSSDIYRNIACIIWENNSYGEQTITIIDKFDLFEDESATATIDGDILLLDYTFTSKIPIPTSTMAVELRDNKYNFGLNYFENILKISGSPLIQTTGTVSKNNSIETLIIDTYQHEPNETDSQNDVTLSELESGTPFKLPSIMVADTSQWGFSDIMTKRYLADIEETIKENDSKIQALRNADAPKEIPVVELELPRVEENLLQIEQEKAQLILNEILRKDIHNWRESYISHTSEIDIKQLSTLTGIPYDSLQPWMSNLEMWVAEGTIDLADMIVAIEYLINP